MTSKHMKNDFFPWMDGVFSKEMLIKSAKPYEIESWNVYWSDDPKNFYGFTAYIFWKSTSHLFGYNFFYLYEYDDSIMHSKYGPFESIEEMKNDFNIEGGYNMHFPDDMEFT